MITRLTSSGRIISTIYRDIGLMESGWEDDAVEWISRIVDSLGFNTCILERTSAELEIESYKTFVPPDFRKIIGLYYEVAEDPVLRTKLIRSDALMKNRILNEAQSGHIPANAYWMDGSKIVFGVVDGTAYLDYFKNPTDGDGWPMIPDLTEVEQTILWFVITRKILGGWSHPDRTINFQTAHQYYINYLNSARSRLNIPDEDEMDEIIREWTGITTDDYFGRNLGVASELTSAINFGFWIQGTNL